MIKTDKCNVHGKFTEKIRNKKQNSEDSSTMCVNFLIKGVGPNSIKKCKILKNL